MTLGHRHRVYQKNQDSDKIGVVADNLIQGWNNVFSDL
ncbi:hypothetical protein M2408_004486 [Sphingobacterium sp. BIGb0165]|nr:hypothetical protein [Sphingobacterium sp. BIGb0165]